MPDLKSIGIDVEILCMQAKDIRYFMCIDVAYNFTTLRHQKKYAWAPLPVAENHIKNSNSFQRYRGQRLHPFGLRYKNRAAVRGLS